VIKDQDDDGDHNPDDDGGNKLRRLIAAGRLRIFLGHVDNPLVELVFPSASQWQNLGSGSREKP
jgi:hypothetical protein